MKTALVHEWLTTLGGSEMVLEAIHELYPSPIHVLVADPEGEAAALFPAGSIRTSFIQRLPGAVRRYRSYLPLFPLAVEQFDLRAYDVIISSSHAVAKGVLTRATQLHVCYCHTPARYAWDMYFPYLRDSFGEGTLKAAVAAFFLHGFRKWDVSSSNNVDLFVANSSYVAARIRRCYRRKAVVIHPPVDVEPLVEVSGKSVKEDYYVAVSRMVPYKKMDLIVEAFASMPTRRLVMVGDGPERSKLESLARGCRNVELVGRLPRRKLIECMSRARALVFAAEEDFGIVPVEAQACGTPVIAYGAGGALETVVDGVTGVFFGRQEPDSLREAVVRFERMEERFDEASLHENAMRFSRKRFLEEFRRCVEKAWEAFCGGTDPEAALCGGESSVRGAHPLQVREQR